MSRIPARGKNRIIVIALICLFTIAGVGTALAYWSAGGSGSGAAVAGQSSLFTVTGATPDGTIAPGSAGQTVVFTVTNPGTGTQNLNNVAVTLANSTGVAWVPPTNCLIGDFTAAITTAPTYGAIAPAGTVTGTVTVTLANTGANQDACKGVTVPLYFTTT